MEAKPGKNKIDGLQDAPGAVKCTSQKNSPASLAMDAGGGGFLSFADGHIVGNEGEQPRPAVKIESDSISDLELPDGTHEPSLPKLYELYLKLDKTMSKALADIGFLKNVVLKMHTFHASRCIVLTPTSRAVPAQRQVRRALPVLERNFELRYVVGWASREDTWVVLCRDNMLRKEFSGTLNYKLGRSRCSPRLHPWGDIVSELLMFLYHAAYQVLVDQMVVSCAALGRNIADLLIDNKRVQPSYLVYSPKPSSSFDPMFACLDRITKQPLILHPWTLFPIQCRSLSMRNGRLPMCD